MGGREKLPMTYNLDNPQLNNWEFIWYQIQINDSMESESYFISQIFIFDKLYGVL